MPLQIIGVILVLIGLFGNIPILFFIGGFMCLLLDVVGFASGKLKPVVPIILYVIGYAYVGNWEGILLGSAIGNLIDVIPILLGLSFGTEERKESNSLDERINKRAKKKNEG